MSAIEQPAVLGTRTAVDGESTKQPFVYKGMLLLFIVLISCFTAWGIAADMTAPLVAAFKRIFTMSTFEASLVQFAYYGAYFLLALPAAFINQRFGYKAGILTGLGLASLGAFAFFPASKIMTYSIFLLALFALAAGLSILETSANPFVISMGPEQNATRRLNLAQAFNPVGTNIGVFLAATLILPQLHDPIDRGSVSAGQLRDIQAGELKAVMVPYIGLAVLLLIIWAGDQGGIPVRGPGCRPGWRHLPATGGQSAVPVRGHRAVFQHRSSGVHLDVHDSIRPAGAGRHSAARWLRPADQPHRLPLLALPHDVADGLHPSHGVAGGARRPRRAAVRLRDD
jgi:MFS family permease